MIIITSIFTSKFFNKKFLNRWLNEPGHYMMFLCNADNGKHDYISIGYYYKSTNFI